MHREIIGCAVIIHLVVDVAVRAVGSTDSAATVDDQPSPPVVISAASITLVKFLFPVRLFILLDSFSLFLFENNFRAKLLQKSSWSILFRNLSAFL